METEESEVSWSEVYSDFFLATDVLSACLPVRDVYTAELLGVTCVDVNVTFFRSLDNSDEVSQCLGLHQVLASVWDQCQHFQLY